MGSQVGSVPQEPVSKQSAAPPPTYPVSHAKNAPPLKSVSPRFMECAIPGSPQSETVN